MYGMSQQQLSDDAGTLPADGSHADIEQGNDPFGESVEKIYDATRFANSESGIDRLNEQGMMDRNQQFGDLFQSVNGRAPDIHYTGSDLADVYENKQPSNGPSVSGFSLMHPLQPLDIYNLANQLGEEKDWDKVRQQYPQAAIPTPTQIVNNSRNLANDMDQEAAEAQQHSAGFNLTFGVLPAPGLGRITGAGLVGGFAAVNSAQNPRQALSMLTGGAEGNWLQRGASMALQQMGVSLAVQSSVVNPERQSAGLSTMTTPEMLQQALLTGTMAGTIEGSMRYFFPGTTPAAAQPVSAALDRMAEAGDRPEGQLAKGLINAQTPDQAAATMSAAPLETQLDVAHTAAGDNASTGERAILQAGEQELLAEKAQPDGVDWPQHIQNLQATAQAIEAGQPVPEFTPAAQEGVKYPVQQWLRQQGGVEVGSALDGELRNMGINPKTAPGLFRAEGKGGLADVDNIPLSEWKMSAAKADDTGSYVDRQYVLDALAAERTGRPVTNEGNLTPEHGTIIPGSEDDLRQYAHSLGIDTEGNSPQRVLEMVRGEEMKQSGLRQTATPDTQLPETTPRAKQREAQLQQRYKEIDATVANAEKRMKASPSAEAPGDRPGSASNDAGKRDIPGQQTNFFKDLKPDDAAPIDDDKAMTVKEAVEEIRDHEALMQAMTTCFKG